MTYLTNNYKKYDFMRFTTSALLLSAFLIVISIALIFFKGFRLGLDFTGGYVIEVSFKNPVEISKVRKSLYDAGYKTANVRLFGGAREVTINIPNSQISSSKEDNIISILKNIDPTAIKKRTEFIGPSVGAQLAEDAALALVSALFAIAVYSMIRFDWRLAIGIVLALVHDVVLTLGVASIGQIEINMTILAALMSVIGYSLNDSIVIADRIRENARKFSTSDPSVKIKDLVNISTSQTLRRTIMTSASTILVSLILLILGGDLLRGFSILLIVGILVGTVSSIYVACAIAILLGLDRKHLLSSIDEKDNYSSSH